MGDLDEVDVLVRRGGHRLDPHLHAPAHVGEPTPQPRGQAPGEVLGQLVGQPGRREQPGDDGLLGLAVAKLSPRHLAVSVG